MNDENPYNYKSRWDMVWRGFTQGDDEAEYLGLGKDYRNWSPVLVHAYQLGVFAGIFACLFSFLVGELIKVILRQ